MATKQKTPYEKKTNNEIIQIIYDTKMLDLLINHITRNSTIKGNDILNDLKNDIYLSLLEMDNDKLNGLMERKQMKFFLARICLNQLVSNTSSFYRKYRKQIQFDTTVKMRETDELWMQNAGNDDFQLSDGGYYED